MSKKRSKKAKKRRLKVLNIITSILLVIVSGYLIYSLYSVDLLSTLYFVIFSGGLVALDLILILILNKKFKTFIKVPFFIIAVLIIGVGTYGIYNLNNTANFIKKVVNNAGVREEVFSVYVLKDSEYEKLTDLDGKNLGIYSKGSDLLEEAVDKLNKKVTFENEEKYDDIEKLLEAGDNKDVDALFISASMKDLMSENYNDLFIKYRELDTIVVVKKEKVTRSKVNVAKEPFVLYISGIDTKGSINNVGRSDVNILAVVNPKEGKILLVHVPRDYYVKLHSKQSYDKLTHSGIYGIDESQKTMEDIFSRDIDFYFKANFSTVITLVEALGGITVNVPTSFCEQDSNRRQGYYYNQCVSRGVQTLNGEKALALARHRHGLSNGDVSRGENQELVIEAIIEKLTSKSVIANYSSILSSIDNYLVTNMDEKSISRLVKLQQEKDVNWEIESLNVSGEGAYRTTYSGGSAKLYVMIPDDASITKVKQKISEYMGEDVQEESESKVKTSKK